MGVAIALLWWRQLATASHTWVDEGDERKGLMPPSHRVSGSHPRPVAIQGQLLQEQLQPLPFQGTGPGMRPWFTFSAQVENNLSQKWQVCVQPTIHFTQNMFSPDENETPTFASK